MGFEHEIFANELSFVLSWALCRVVNSLIIGIFLLASTLISELKPIVETLNFSIKFEPETWA